MEIRRTLSCLLTITSALACHAGRRGPGEGPRGEPQEFGTSSQLIAQVVGLPSIEMTWRTSRIEHRFELSCSLCLPGYLFRIQKDRRGQVRGEAFLLWFAPPLPDDTSEGARNIRERPGQCAGPLQPAGKATPDNLREHYSWCRVRIARATDWSRVLATLDSLGITKVGTATGYWPDPPAAAPETTLVSGRPVLRSGGGCSDIGGQELGVESRDDAGVRRAEYWCLENPQGAEFQRAAAARRVMMSLIRGPE